MNSIVTSSFNNPLIGFEALIQNGGIENCYDRFRLDEEMLTGNLSTNDNIEFFFSEQDEYGEHIPIKVSFPDKLNIEFKTAYKKTLRLLSDYFATFISTKELEEKLVHVLNTIVFLHKYKFEINMHQQNQLIDNWLFKLIRFIKDKYPSVNNSHTAFKLIGEVQEANLTKNIYGFQKGIKTVPQLYEILVELNFFDEDDDQYDNFYRVLTSFPEKSSVKLKVACNNQKAAYILYTLKKKKVLFKKLTYRRISNSEIFCNKRNKPFNENDLSKALSTFIKNKEKNKDIIVKIDSAFDNLII